MLKRAVLFVLDPPWTREGPETLTLAVPDAHSTFNRGDVGWAHRPPALLQCPSCNAAITHDHATDIIRCSTCRFEQSPDEFDQLELIELDCPDCHAELDHGTRHPNLFDVPQWATCPECHYHWELHHF